jgi:hypothetical protein
MVQLGELALWLGLAVSPVLVPALLLNLRDRRESAVLGTVGAQLSSRELRGRIAVRVRCALLGKGGVVALDMRDCSQEEIWGAMVRLSRSLPPTVQLVVDGVVDRDAPVTFAVQAAARRRPGRSPRLLAPAG